MAALFAWHVSFYFIICLARFILFHYLPGKYHFISFCFIPFHSVSIHFIIWLARFILFHSISLFAWHVSFYVIICLALFILFHSVSFHFIICLACFNPFQKHAW